MINIQLSSVLTLLVVSSTNGYSTLRGSSKNTTISPPHPALCKMAGSWNMKNGVSTSALGPFSHSNGTWLTVTEADTDGTIYLKHDVGSIYLDLDKDHRITSDQLIRVHNYEVQYCTHYSEAPFQLMPIGFDGNDPSTVDFCWRGPRLPTHKANCTGCDCAHWQLQLGADGKSMKSIMWQSYPAIHFEIDLIKTNTNVSTEEVIDGWECEFSNNTGPLTPPMCPYLKLQSKKERTKSSLSLPDTNIDPAKKFCLSVSNYDTVHNAELDYTVPQIPCMPCNISFVFSVLTDEGDYVALGFRGYSYAYQDWNNQTTDENRESGGFPDYFGMSTSSNWESKKYSPQGRIALGYQGYFREMKATHYTGPPSDLDDEEPLLTDTSVEYVDGRTIIRFSAEMYAGNTTEDIDWQSYGNLMGIQRIMWATGPMSGDGSNATVGFHGSARAISPFAFPGYNEPRRCKGDDTYLSIV